MFDLNKTARVGNSEPEAVVGRQVDFSKMMESLATDVVLEINNCYYGNGTLNEDRADRALQSIRGRMQAVKQMVQSMK